MADTNHATAAPWHLWVIGILLVLWQGMAVFDYIATCDPVQTLFIEIIPMSSLEYYFNAPSLDVCGLGCRGVWRLFKRYSFASTKQDRLADSDTRIP